MPVFCFSQQSLTFLRSQFQSWVPRRAIPCPCSAPHHPAIKSSRRGLASHRTRLRPLRLVTWHRGHRSAVSGQPDVDLDTDWTFRHVRCVCVLAALVGGLRGLTQAPRPAGTTVTTSLPHVPVEQIYIHFISPNSGSEREYRNTQLYTKHTNIQIYKYEHTNT